MSSKENDVPGVVTETVTEHNEEDDDEDETGFPFDDLEGFEVVDEVEDQADELLDEVEAQLEQAGVGQINDSLESAKDEVTEELKSQPTENEPQKENDVEMPKETSMGEKSKQDVENTEEISKGDNNTELEHTEDVEAVSEQAEQEVENVEVQDDENIQTEELIDGEEQYIEEEVEEEVEEEEIGEETEELVIEEIEEHEDETTEGAEMEQVEAVLEGDEEHDVEQDEGQEEENVHVEPEAGQQEEAIEEEVTGEQDVTGKQDELQEETVEDVMEEHEVEDVEYVEEEEEVIDEECEEEETEEFEEVIEEEEEECEEDETEEVEEIEEIEEIHEGEEGTEEKLGHSTEENAINGQTKVKAEKSETVDILCKSTRVHVHPVRLSDLKDIALEPSLKKAVCCSLRFFGPRCCKGPGSLEVRFATYEEALEEKQVITKMAASHEKLFKATLIKPGEGPMDWILNEWQKSIQPPGIFDSRCVFVNNVPDFTREEMLRALYPTAESVHLPRSSDGVSHGYSMLEFGSPEEADEIVTSSKNYQTRIGDNILKLNIIAKVPTATGTVKISTEDLVQEIISEERKKDRERCSKAKVERKEEERRKRRESKGSNSESKQTVKDSNKKHHDEKTSLSGKGNDDGRKKGTDFKEGDRRRSSQTSDRRSPYKRNDAEHRRRSSGSKDTSKSRSSSVSDSKHLNAPNSARTQSSKSPAGRSSNFKSGRSSDNKETSGKQQAPIGKSATNNTKGKPSNMGKVRGKPVPTVSTERKPPPKTVPVANPANVIPVQLGRTGHTGKRPIETTTPKADKRMRMDGPPMAGSPHSGQGYQPRMNRPQGGPMSNRRPMSSQGVNRSMGNFRHPSMNTMNSGRVNQQPRMGNPQGMGQPMGGPAFPNNNNVPMSDNSLMPNNPSRPNDMPNRNQLFMRQGPIPQIPQQQMSQQIPQQQMSQRPMPQQKMPQRPMQQQQIPQQQMSQQQMPQQQMLPQQPMSQRPIPQQQMSQQPMPQQQMSQHPFSSQQMQQQPMPPQQPMQIQQQQLQQQPMPPQQQNFGGPVSWPGNQNTNPPDKWERNPAVDPQKDIHNLRGELLKQLQVLETGNISDPSDLSDIALKLKQVQESRVSTTHGPGSYSNPQTPQGNYSQGNFQQPSMAQMNVQQQQPHGMSSGTFQNSPSQFQSQGNFQNPVHIQQQQPPPIQQQPSPIQQQPSPIQQQSDVYRAFSNPMPSSGPMGDQPINNQYINQGNNNQPMGAFDRNPGFRDMEMGGRGGMDSYHTSHGMGVNENSMSEKLRRTVCVDNLPQRIQYSEVKNFFKQEMIARRLCGAHDFPVDHIQETINGRTTILFRTEEFAIRVLSLDKINYKGHILNLCMM